MEIAPNITWSRREFLILGLILAIASVLLFSNLDNRYLWQDEAQTALIAKTVNEYGVPKGYDGKNYFSQELGAEYGDNYIWKWHTWLPFYLLAAFFKLFGTSTYVARLPFALFGLASLFGLYIFCRALFNDKKTAAFAAVLLALSVPFLILSRQCRYYSLTAFFSIAGLYGYHGMIRKKGSGPTIYFLASTFLFHTHYIYLATMLGAVAGHLILFHRRHWRRTVLWTLAVLAINAPWIIWLSGMRYSEQYSGALFNLPLFLANLSSFLKDIRQHVFPVYLFIALVAAFAWSSLVNKETLPVRETRFWEAVSLPLLFIMTTLAALSLTAPAAFFRYLTPLLPFLFILAGLFLRWATQIHLLAGIALLITIIFSGPMNDYLYEITNDYDDPIRGIVSYLKKQAAQNDVVAITYDDLPLKFYTGLRVTGGLTGEELTQAANADWIIIRRNIICEKDQKVHDYLISHVQWQYYEKQVLNYPDVPFSNRESPGEHLFYLPGNYPSVVIYQKMKQTPE